MKNTYMLCALLATFIVASNSAIAQKKGKSPSSKQEPQAWTKEPDSFLGIKFGESLPSSVERCPERNGYASPDFDRIKALSSICLWGRYGIKDSYEIYNTPSFGFPYSASLKTEADRPSWFAIKTEQRNFEQLASVLVQRYGDPTERSVDTVKTKAGAEFTSTTYVWKGKKVRISLEERAHQIDETWVLIADLELAAERVKKLEQSAKDAASKL